MLVSRSCRNTHSSGTQQNFFFHGPGGQKAECRVGGVACPLSSSFWGKGRPWLPWLVAALPQSPVHLHTASSASNLLPMRTLVRFRAHSITRDYPLWTSLISHICKDLCQIREHSEGFQGGSSGTESTYQCRRQGFDPWVGKIPWRRAWQPTPVFWPGNPQGQGGAWWAAVHGAAKSQTRLSN